MNEEQIDLDFDGHTYEKEHDQKRLTGQLLAIVDIMKNGEWFTVQELAYITGFPEASISAQLRNLRKGKFGNHQTPKRHRGKRKSGLYEFQLILNKK